MENELKKAVLWESQTDDKLRCNLCNWRCLISVGKRGRCGVRQNIDGEFFSLNYSKVCSANSDPIEKKPLFHFQPSSLSFSISTPGCNFQCIFCQNWQISQSPVEEGAIQGTSILPAQIVDAAIKNNCSSIAYTYTEPTVFMELACECGKLAREKGLANVFVSNGYMTREAVEFVRPWLDGINIDIKAFTEDFYENFCKAKLQPVLDTIKYISANTNIWMEITTLLIPDENDSEEELKNIADFIVKETGPDTPWHVSRFHPMHKLNNKSTTSADKLDAAYNIGKQAGLKYVYVGNLPGARAESTFCHSCGQILIERVGYTIISNKIDDYRCPACGAEIKGFQLC